MHNGQWNTLQMMITFDIDVQYSGCLVFFCLFWCLLEFTEFDIKIPKKIELLRRCRASLCGLCSKVAFGVNKHLITWCLYPYIVIMPELNRFYTRIQQKVTLYPWVKWYIKRILPCVFCLGSAMCNVQCAVCNAHRMWENPLFSCENNARVNK